MLTGIAGSSSYFWGGIISYENQVKERLLNVKPEDLIEFGAVSHQVAKQMAVGVRASLNTSWGLSITGIAGPGGGTDSKPVGLVYVGLALSLIHISEPTRPVALDRLRRKILLAKVEKI
jgi:nicotinamide-nucleotide amidase